MNKVIKFVDIDVDGIDTKDYPDFCDAYICSATAVLEDGLMRDANEDELNELNEDCELIYEHVLKRIY